MIVREYSSVAALAQLSERALHLHPYHPDASEVVRDATVVPKERNSCDAFGQRRDAGWLSGGPPAPSSIPTAGFAGQEDDGARSGHLPSHWGPANECAKVLVPRDTFFLTPCPL